MPKLMISKIIPSLNTRYKSLNEKLGAGYHHCLSCQSLLEELKKKPLSAVGIGLERSEALNRTELNVEKLLILFSIQFKC